MHVVKVLLLVHWGGQAIYNLIVIVQQVASNELVCVNGMFYK